MVTLLASISEKVRRQALFCGLGYQIETPRKVATKVAEQKKQIQLGHLWYPLRSGCD
jgi:hypothetical protein